jgi:hypothetical protein
VQLCTPDDGSGGGGGSWPFFNDGDSNIYEAPGDPSPGAAGVWLGSDVQPATCFEAGLGAVTATDLDGDGLSQHCEYSIARSFAPMLHYGTGESCPGGEPYWAAKRFPSGIVRIAYMMAYYRDCGYNADAWASEHTGDSEFIMVQVKFNESTQHWEFDQMWLSAHYEATLAGQDVDYSSWVSAANTIFYDRYLAFPKVWAAEDKHANYRSVDVCRNVGAFFWQDECGSTNIIRFPVKEARNTGSRYVDLVNCVRSEGKTTSTRVEGFYTDCNDAFRGWNEVNYGTPPKTYRYMLFKSHFEYD